MSKHAKSATINVSMPPRQSFQPPSQPQQPQRSFTPQSPHYGYGAQDTQHFQQHPSGHYEVLPPPQSNPNNGHSGHNPYDFIVNPNTSTHPGSGMGSLFGGNAFLMRIAVLVGGAVVLIIVATLVISALTPKGDKPGLISIAQRQQEIVRVATAAGQQTTSQDAKNFIANVQMSVSSDQYKTLGYLTTHGTKLGGKALALDQSTTTDSQLADAATANNYDSAVTENLSQQLQVYQNLLSSTFSDTNSKTAQALLQGEYNNAGTLIKQAKALEQELGN